MHPLIKHCNNDFQRVCNVHMIRQAGGDAPLVEKSVREAVIFSKIGGGSRYVFTACGGEKSGCERVWY